MNRFSHVLVVGIATLILGVAAFGVSRGKPTETVITELAPGVYFRKLQTEPTFLGCNQGWIHFKDFVLVIDANFPSQAEEITALIRKQTDKKIR